MKWSNSNRKREPFSTAYSRTARKDGWKATVSYTCNGNYFYFVCEKDDEAYNSLWEHLCYRTEEECLQACEKWIDERSDKE